MPDFLANVTALTGLRDRDALDQALVRLVAQTGHGHFSAVRLVRIVGDSDDARCMVRAQCLAGRPVETPDDVWSDWRSLPPLAGQPQREQALLALAPSIHANGDGCLSLFAVHAPPGTSGLLEIESTQEPNATQTRQIRQVLQTHANILGLLDYGEKDSLTELLNRKTFDTSFFKAVADQERWSLPIPADRRQDHEAASYWLAVIDIDHFKRVNDTHGHLIGDEVLLLMARLMRRNFRLQDMLFRFGGEEFVVLMRCTSHQSAAEVMERFRQGVEAHDFPQAGRITVSAGFDALRPQDTPSGAFGRADLAVYHAKTHGRNQVCCYADLVRAGVLQELTPASSDVDLF